MKPIKGGMHPGNDADAMLKTMANLIVNSSKEPDPETAGADYSELLLELVKPYRREDEELEDLEYLLDVGIAGWNMAVLKQKDDLLYKTYQNGITSGDFDDETRQLIEHITRDKNQKFEKYDFMLEDVEVAGEQEGVEVGVRVTAVPFGEFIQHILEGDENDEWEDEEEYFEGNKDPFDEPEIAPGYIDRSAVAVFPRQPYIDWLMQIYAPEQPPVRKDHTLYLVEEAYNAADIIKWLKKDFDNIFQQELDAWHSDQKDWPANRTYEMFTDWFEIRTFSSVYDMQNAPVEKI